MAIHSCILAWRIPRTEEPGGLQSIGLQTVGHDWSDLARMHARLWINSLHIWYKGRKTLFNNNKKMFRHKSAAAAAKSLQSCPTPWDPIGGSLPGSPVPGILQARTLEWVAISFSDAWKWKVKLKSLSCVQFLATPWIAAYQAPPSMEFSRQEYWSGLPLPSPRNKSEVYIKIYLRF